MLVGRAQDRFADPLPFCTDDQGYRSGQVDLVQRLFRRDLAGQHPQARGFQEFDGAEQALLPADRQFRQRPRGGLDRLGRDLRAVLGRNDQCIHPGQFGRAGNGAEIAHVGYPVEQHQQRRRSAIEEKGQ